MAPFYPICGKCKFHVDSQFTYISDDKIVAKHCTKTVFLLSYMLFSTSLHQFPLWEFPIISHLSLAERRVVVAVAAVADSSSICSKAVKVTQARIHAPRSHLCKMQASRLCSALHTKAYIMQVSVKLCQLISQKPEKWFL
jgi:hypothetical protein